VTAPKRRIDLIQLLEAIAQAFLAYAVVIATVQLFAGPVLPLMFVIVAVFCVVLLVPEFYKRAK
jgi:fatty acid desaturase